MKNEEFVVSCQMISQNLQATVSWRLLDVDAVHALSRVTHDLEVLTGNKWTGTHVANATVTFGDFTVVQIS